MIVADLDIFVEQGLWLLKLSFQLSLLSFPVYFVMTYINAMRNLLIKFHNCFQLLTEDRDLPVGYS